VNRPPKDAEHLSDGCYASFDSWQIWLWAERENGWHCVALEPYTFKCLVEYPARVWEEPS
jgi:hypothetical protein